MLGGLTERGRTPLVVVAGNLTGKRYRDEIIQRYVIPCIQSQVNNVTFHQDNATPHVVGVVRDYLTQQNVDVLPWPTVLAYLSPIEHVWDKMERRLRHLQNQQMTLEEMSPALIRIWNNIRQAFLIHLLNQCVAVVKPSSLKRWTYTLLSLLMSRRPLCCSKHLPNEFK